MQLIVAKSDFLAKFDLSASVAFFKSAFVALINKYNSIFIFPLKGFG